MHEIIKQKVDTMVTFNAGSFPLRKQKICHFAPYFVRSLSFLCVEKKIIAETKNETKQNEK